MPDARNPEAATPEMIEAGLAVLYESGALEHWMGDVDAMLIERIYSAMIAASPDHRHPDASHATMDDAE